MFNSAFDPTTLKKLADLLNSPKGTEIKQYLSGVNKDELYKKLLQLNISQNDIETITKKINMLSNEEILNTFLKIRGD